MPIRLQGNELKSTTICQNSYKTWHITVLVLFFIFLFVNICCFFINGDIFCKFSYLTHRGDGSAILYYRSYICLSICLRVLVLVAAKRLEGLNWLTCFFGLTVITKTVPDSVFVAVLLAVLTITVSQLRYSVVSVLPLIWLSNDEHQLPIHFKTQHCVQLPAFADNVTLLALAAERRAAVHCAAGRLAAMAVNRSSTRRAHSSKPAACCCTCQ